MVSALVRSTINTTVRNTGRFDGPGDQSAGLMANGSSSADHYPVNPVVLETAGHLRFGHFDQP